MVTVNGAAPSPRLASIDAYRGRVMILMQADALRLCAVAAGVPDSWLWGQLCYELFGPAFEPVVHGSAILACYWVVLYVMYRRRMVVRI